MSSIWALALAAGCAGTSVTPVTLEHRSVLEIETRGMALSADGSRGHAGMYGVTCDFRTRSAEIGADYDFPSDEETVEDGLDSVEDGFESLTSSPDRVHLTNLEQGSSVDLRAANVVHTRLFADRVVVVRDTTGECVGQYLPRQDGAIVTVRDLPAAACEPDASVTVDRDEGELYVATDEGVLVLSDVSWAFVGVEADRIAWDGWSRVLYAADVDADEIRAVDAAGEVLWSVTVDGRVRDLAHLGEVGAAVVSVARGGAGGIVVLDGATGEVRAEVETPSAADRLVAADSGAVLALVTGSQTHFYDVEP